MRRTFRVALALALLGSLGVGGGGVATARTATDVRSAPQAAPTAATPGACVDGKLPSGALSKLCVPASGWNGDLVVWGHGYVAFNEPIAFYHLEIPNPDGGPPIILNDLVQKLGFAFAATSYRQNGLAILEGVQDVRELIASFTAAHGRPGRTYMVGASEGGIITTMLAERSPGLINGALSACGPVGDFQRQIDYIGDFRVLFDYFFPGVLPGSAAAIPSQLIANWESTYVPAVKAALAANPVAAEQLIRTSRAPVDPADPASRTETTLNVLWYNVFATNDAVAKLGGNPYGNRARVYSGSTNDQALNAGVQRFTQDPATLPRIAPYQTSGQVTIPQVMLHTTGDEIIPFGHEVLYHQKVQRAGSTANVTQLPITDRYGHCNFKPVELVGAFAVLVRKVSGAELSGVAQPFDLAQAQRDFERAASRPGAP